MLSKYLPPGWNLASPIALLAGQGGEDSYPWELAKAAQAKGVCLKLIALKSETSLELEKLFKPEDIRRVAV